jgi:exopolyphosphatase / guanosine-5'-triphosphate,3'-diphosphate pyrophosphatase
MKFAAIDIGSNSVHMIIAAVSGARSFEVIDRVKEMVFLGRSVADSGRLTPEALSAGVEAVAKFHKLAQRHRVDEIRAVATAAVREATNGGEFLYAICARTGINPQVISGNEEARYIYLGVRNAIDLSEESALVFDIGGGSVEIMLGNAQRLSLGTSIKLGVQRLRSEFGADPLGRRDRKALETRVQDLAGPLIEAAHERGFDFAAGTSGTILALAEAAARARGANAWTSASGRVLELTDLRLVTDQLALLTPAERVARFGIDVNRADSLHLGGVLLSSLLELARVSQLTLCQAALREGIVLDFLEHAPQQIVAYDLVRDIRRHSVLELAEHCGQSRPHPAHVAALALELFDQTSSLHGLSVAERHWLEYAALLHDIGQHIGYERHEHHAAYIIQNADLRGFRAEERAIIALVARYHRKGRPCREDQDFAALSAPARHAVRVLSGILRLADGLDRSHHQLVRSLRIAISSKRLLIRAVTDEDAELEIWGARRKSRLLERALGMEIELSAEVASTPDRKTA